MTDCKNCETHQAFTTQLFALVAERFAQCPSAADEIAESLALVLTFHAHLYGVPREEIIAVLRDADDPPFAFAAGIAEALSDYALQNGPGGEA